VGPRAILDAVVKRKIPSPRRESNLRTPIVQPVAKRYTDSTVFIEKFVVAQSLWNLEVYRSVSQKPDIESYPEPDESSP
jgi:hypothetical protein